MKLKVTLYLHSHRNWKGDIEYVPDTCDRSKWINTEYTLLETKEVLVEFGDVNYTDIVKQEVAMLQEKKKTVLAEAHIKAEQIQDHINKLLAIEHKPEASHEPV
jgi:hypothetical protein